MSDAPEPLDAIGTRILFENEAVRVWDFVLDPGEVSPLHRHRHDYLIVYLSPRNELEVRVLGEAPKGVSTGDGYVAHTSVGSGGDPALIHRLANVGAQPHRQIVVELLQAPAREGPARTARNDAGSDAWADR